MAATFHRSVTLPDDVTWEILLAVEWVALHQVEETMHWSANVTLPDAVYTGHSLYAIKAEHDPPLVTDEQLVGSDRVTYAEYTITTTTGIAGIGMLVIEIELHTYAHVVRISGGDEAKVVGVAALLTREIENPRTYPNPFPNPEPLSNIHGVSYEKKMAAWRLANPEPANAPQAPDPENARWSWLPGFIRDASAEAVGGLILIAVVAIGGVVWALLRA